jgi:two-component system, cell cycle response regulator
MSELDLTQVSSFDEKVVGGESCLVQIHGPGLGRRFALIGGELTIGRDGKNAIVVDLDTVSRRHAKIVIREGRSYVVDLKSTNGTYLNDKEVLEELPLRSGDYVKVGGSIFKFLSGGDIESLYHEEIYRLTIVDGLTQINNKRFLLEFLEREIGRSQRYGRALSLLLFDIDHFKTVNDNYGHPAGDAVLREMALRIKQYVRKEECFARYGGEEFAIALPESGPENSRKFAEKVRRLIADQPFEFEGQKFSVTISVGVAELSGQMSEPIGLIKIADANLYKAKKAGRNRVAC